VTQRFQCCDNRPRINEGFKSLRGNKDEFFRNQLTRPQSAENKSRLPAPRGIFLEPSFSASCWDWWENRTESRWSASHCCVRGSVAVQSGAKSVVPRPAAGAGWFEPSTLRSNRPLTAGSTYHLTINYHYLNAITPNKPSALLFGPAVK
jgi:hypothetical protein